MSKFLLNLLLQISKALVNSKIQFYSKRIFFSEFVPPSPASPVLACSAPQAAMRACSAHLGLRGLGVSTTAGAGNQVKSQGQQNFMRGRVNHMTSEDAQQAPDVVLGMFLASSHPVTILFDSGASHSFISSSFVVKHSMPIATIKHTILVSSPGGEMRTKHICPAVSISIRGVDFTSNLILLDSKGIDIILGMDWLSKYDGDIQCARKAVKLTKKDGTSVEFIAMVQSGPDSKLNHTKAIALEDI
jgi:hypothetical protein